MNFKSILIVASLFYSITSLAQPKLDLEQNDRISKLEKSLKLKPSSSAGKNYDKEIVDLKI